jgi:two-component system, OmpR family, phosphate regulon sensor histidine kinase PhoR
MEGPRMHLGYRGRIFLASFAVAAASLLLVATLVSLSLPGQTTRRLERSLGNEARLLTELLAEHGVLNDRADLERRAEALGRTLGARVTFIARDGTVVGDSMVAGAALAQLDNHAGRPEVRDAASRGVGSARRFSDTLRTDMLYVAVRTTHPDVTTIRLALPLTEIQSQLAEVRRLTFIALAVALAGAAVLAFVSSTLLTRRLHAIAEAATRFAAGDTSRPLRDYEPDEIGTVARVLDDTVSALAQRAQELARDRARANAILAGMVEGVMVVDHAGHVQLVNPAARAILALPDETPAGHYLEYVRHPDVAALLTAALERREPATVEFSPPRASDRRIVGRSAAVSAPGNTGAVLVLHDITDLRRADQMRRDFVANVSHELRTPLTAIRGYVEALSDEPVTAEDRARFLEVIGRHVQRMERLVKDLLRLAGLDAKQEAVDLADSPTQALLASAVADLAPVIEARSQRVDVSVDPSIATIRTDAPKLQDVLRNLLENAVAYSPTGKLIRLEAVAAEGRVLIQVLDEGPGIPDDDLERIFERFYRVDKARSRESGGTGLGLSIVKHLVDLLGGRVWAANRPGGGAVFTISLPATAPVARLS